MDTEAMPAIDDLSDAELAALAAELTAAVLAAVPGSGPAWAHPPLAASGVGGSGGGGNPYWQIVRNLPTETLGDQTAPTTSWLFANPAIGERVHAAGLERVALCRRYSWSIPSPGDIAWISAAVGGRGVVEPGAGGGYWARLLRAAGVDTLAYDPYPASDTNGFAKRAHTSVELGDDSVTALHGDRALFLCWPSNNDPWAARAVTAYHGDMLIYTGQDSGGFTGDDRFFEILDSGWEHVDTSADHVAYSGVPCGLTLWRR